jgi:hypothetical protein
VQQKSVGCPEPVQEASTIHDIAALFAAMRHKTSLSHGAYKANASRIFQAIRPSLSYEPNDLVVEEACIDVSDTDQRHRRSIGQMERRVAVLHFLTRDDLLD